MKAVPNFQWNQLSAIFEKKEEQFVQLAKAIAKIYLFRMISTTSSNFSPAYTLHLALYYSGVVVSTAAS